jgi:hypothetical protein
MKIMRLFAAALLLVGAAQDKPSISDFTRAADPAGRRAAFDKLIAMGPDMARSLNAIIDAKLGEFEKRTSALLAPKVRAAYLKRLAELTDEQIQLVVKTRRFWKDYLLHGGGRERFREIYLRPVREIAEFLLLKTDEIQDEELQAQRTLLEEYNSYRTACHQVLKINPDPTVRKKSPTGIAYAPLDQPPTFLDTMSHLERTLILCHSVAPEGARRVLMMNDAAAREIDVQEAEFALFCNEVRMLVGTVAWRVEPLGCAVTRDHSNDRTQGKASGHMSSVPGKRGFGDRNQRMGAPSYESEGAGGGGSGRGYANGLSLGDGHTGPLYSLKRNCVGVGRRGGTYTSQYRSDTSLLHPCAVKQDELWMPPGVEARHLRNAALVQIYRALKAKAYGAAQRLIEAAKPKTDLDRALVKFFRAAVDIEAGWFASSVLEIEKTGDVFMTKARLVEGSQRFKGIDSFEEQVAEVSERLKGEEQKREIKIGQAFYQIVMSKYKEPQLHSMMAKFCNTYKKSVYTRALKRVLEEKKNWSDYFTEQNPEAKNYDYPPGAKAGGR